MKEITGSEEGPRNWQAKPEQPVEPLSHANPERAARDFSAPESTENLKRVFGEREKRMGAGERLGPGLER